MKLRNKKTGHIIECSVMCSDENLSPRLIKSNEGRPITLAELNEEWEDVPEEPEDNNYWYIDDFGRVQFSSEILDVIEGKPNNWMIRKSFGNYFETREEAEKAVEKLKAWKRLKDKGFRFQGWEDLEAIELPIKHYNNIIGFRLEDNHDVIVDLNTIFGGEG